MSDALKPYIDKAATGKPLTTEDTKAAFEIIMSGDATEGQIGFFLGCMRVRGETVDEITGAAQVMRDKALKVDAPEGAIDTCGTGGDASGTYNISTAAAFVVAAAGVPVAKHGNRALSSKSGSAEVLAALGVNIELEADQVAACIRDAGIGFMMAPRHHGAMKYVGPVRVQLKTRTMFNLLGPLANPSGVKRQLIGVFAREWVEAHANVLKNLGSEKVWVVHGSDGLDELTTTGESYVAELKDGLINSFTVNPEEVGLAVASEADLKGGEAEENAEALRALLDGASGAYRDIVALNAGAALVIADKAANLKEGVALAQSLIDDGSAKAKLDALVAASNG